MKVEAVISLDVLAILYYFSPKKPKKNRLKTQEKKLNLFYNIKKLHILTGARKFLNLLEIPVFLHKFDLQHYQIFPQVLKEDKEILI